MTAKRRLGTTGYYVVSILIAVVAMIPFLWMISTSLKSRGALMSIPIEWIPAEPSLDAYGEVFSRFPFLKTIGNSLFISVSYTVITLISASMAAFAFAKIRFRCANLLLKLYLASYFDTKAKDYISTTVDFAAATTMSYNVPNAKIWGWDVMTKYTTDLCGRRQLTCGKNMK